MPVSPEQPERQIDALLAQNRAFLEEARAAGGTLYPISAVPSTQDDWRAHFGGSLGWAMFALAKQLFDHRRVLTPGQRIFAP